jgi:hypothetical protein
MTEDEVRLVLATAMAYDNRKPGKAALLAWTEAANRAGWTLEEAQDAVKEHYATSTAFLMPGHITLLIDARRNPARPSLPADSVPVKNVLPAVQAPPASDEARAAAKALLARYPKFASTVALSEERKPRRRTRTAADVERRRIAEAELARLRHRHNPTHEGA